MKSKRVVGDINKTVFHVALLPIGHKMTVTKVICKKLSKTAPDKISNSIKNFKNDLKKRFYEKLESSDGRIRIEILLNRGKSVVEKIWLDFKKIRYTKNRLYKM